MTLFEILKLLVSARSISGREQEVAAVIRRIAESKAADCSVDTMGNLIVHRRGPGRRLLFAAHMDTVGIVLTYIEKEGFLRFGKIGGISAFDLLNTPVIFENGVRGVIVREEKAEIKDLKIEQLYIDIGAADEEAARKLVSIGDTAVFASETYVSGGRVISPYLDNRAGCAVLLSALLQTERWNNDVFFVFTAQEEVGLRGAKTAAYGIGAQYAYAVDVTETGDVPGMKTKNNCKLGGGAAIKLMDNSVICSAELGAFLERTAEQNRIKTQREIMLHGGTDAGAIHITKEGIPAGGISLPVRYIHTPNETADLSDLEACAALVSAVIGSKMNY
jgi:endoglucanase